MQPHPLQLSGPHNSWTGNYNQGSQYPSQGYSQGQDSYPHQRSYGGQQDYNRYLPPSQEASIVPAPTALVALPAAALGVGPAPTSKDSGIPIQRKVVPNGVPARKPVPPRKPLAEFRPAVTEIGPLLSERQPIVGEARVQADTQPIASTSPYESHALQQASSEASSHESKANPTREWSDRLPTIDDFDRVRYARDPAYRNYVQAACTGKTCAPTFEDFQTGMQNEVSEQKIVPNFKRPLFVGDGDIAAANAAAIAIEQRYLSQVEAHNRAIDEKRQMEGGSSLLLSSLDLTRFCKGQIERPLYTQSIKNAGMTRDQFDASFDAMRSTYHTTEDQTDWGRITESVVLGAVTFGIAALPLLDKSQRTKSNVKERAVLNKLHAINADLRSKGIEAQWELCHEGLPLRWVLRMQRVPL